MKHINKKGVELLKKFEACNLQAYLDIGGIPTIGYGSTGADVVMGMSITQAEADRRLGVDISKFEKVINNFVTATLNDNQFSALVCLAYNIGIGSFQRSALLKKLNNRDYVGAVQQFVKWDHVNGKVVDGLLNRRMAERELFLDSSDAV